VTEFRMPALGADMEAATLVRWLKQPGDALARGDIIAVVDTEKGAIEIEVFEDGVLDRALVAPGQKVPVGTALALIRQAGEAPAVAAAAAASPPPAADVVRASPGARRRAEELRVDLTAVTGTGPAGAITREDVERAASRGRTGAARLREVAPGAAEALDRSAGMRAAIAAAMSRSKREIPHLYLSNTIDLTPATTWLAARNQQHSIEQRLLPIALLLKAVAKAVEAVPDVNGFWADGRLMTSDRIHVGCAIALREGGLVAPAIHDTNRKDLDTIMQTLVDLTARARQGSLRSSELSDPTITVTNLGDLGVEQAYAVIYPPQVAIVAFGKALQRPWVVDGRVEPRTTVTATVSADHRALDGRRAGQFLAAVDRYLQTPAGL
jgi:pyruvate dehydrogenase E2 component (dihydrolipoamide acetyltransferase)